MEWLIIVMILMFVVTPVMWLKPSPKQRRLMALRESAKKHGVNVKMEKPPLHHFKGSMPAYRWHYPQDEPGPTFVLVREECASAALEPYHAGWRWRVAPLRPMSSDATQPFESLLERLPQDAMVIESTPQALTLWWWESQSAERFSSYINDFKHLKVALSGLPDQPLPRTLSAHTQKRHF